jgi:glucose-6-phosphate 1-dehydrogenase
MATKPSVVPPQSKVGRTSKAGQTPQVEQATKGLEACTIVLFGASGDLAARMVVPAIFRLWRKGQLATPFALVGYARTPMSNEDFRSLIAKAVLAKAEPGDKEAWPEFAALLTYVSGQYDEDKKGYSQLAQQLERADAQGAGGRRLFYMATPPTVFEAIIRQLSERHLAGKHYAAPKQGWARLVIEKPFGRDLESARALNQTLLERFDEESVYRIDHYLGKEAAQNLFAFRFANGMFEPVWNRTYIDHVQITAAEPLGVEGRGGFYETAGAMRDMLQSHLMQLMALVAIEPPATWNATAVRDEKAKVLGAVRRFSDADVERLAVRGQYGPGTVLGQKVPGYNQEPDVPATSSVETYAAVRCHIDNWRWAGVPFYLRAGKRLTARHTEIAIQFKPAPHTPFHVPENSGAANTLIVEFAPQERLILRIAGKLPGRGIQVGPVELDNMACQPVTGVAPSAYENLLLDALKGDPTFFARADEVEATWEVLDPVLNHWASEPPVAFPNYAAGTDGPIEAHTLLAHEGRVWRSLLATT